MTGTHPWPAAVHARRFCLRPNATYFHGFPPDVSSLVLQVIQELLEQPNHVASHVRYLCVLGINTSESDGEDEDEPLEFLESGDWLQLLPKLTRLLRLSLHGSTVRIPDALRGDLQLIPP